MLDDCAEYSSALSEAAAQRPPPRVRQLYVTIIAQCEIASPSELFQANKEAMWADYKGGHVAGYHLGWLEDKTAEVQERCLTALLCAELLMLAYKTGEEMTWSDLGLPVGRWRRQVFCSPTPWRLPGSSGHRRRQRPLPRRPTP